jgi:hypothetical protein
LGDAVAGHAAHLGHGLERWWGVAQAGQIVGRGQPGRATAHDGDLALVLGQHKGLMCFFRVYIS